MTKTAEQIRQQLRDGTVPLNQLMVDVAQLLASPQTPDGAKAPARHEQQTLLAPAAHDVHSLTDALTHKRGATEEQKPVVLPPVTLAGILTHQR